MEPVTNFVIQTLLQNLYTTLNNEAQTILGFKEEFEKMEKKLNVMTSFLADAQRLESNSGHYMTFKTSLAQIRDLVYDADDILLDCQTRATYEEIFDFRRYTPRALVFRHDAGNRLKDINRRIEDMENHLKTYLSPVTQWMHNSGEVCVRKVKPTSHISTTKIIGLSEDTRKVIGWITTKASSNRVGIVGMGGLGKTTIAQKIFNDVVDHYDKMIWVSVSETVSQKEIIMSMMRQLGINDTVSVDDEMVEIEKCLSNKTYLIVMDDVWSDGEWWRHISSYLPQGEKCSQSLIITTRNESVAESMGATRIHHARKLNPQESWDLFCTVTAIKNVSKDCEFETVGKEIVNKCDGLPLAIKTMGGLLSTKTQSLHQWKQTSKNFFDELANKTSVSATLQLSYDDLPPHLKQCILCFSVYPEDYEITSEQLIYWWVGEGFVRGNIQKSAAEVASDCLLELVNRCLVEAVRQRGYDGRVNKCKMHDLVRQLIIKMAKEAGFCSFDTLNRQMADTDARHIGYTSAMDGQLSQKNSKLKAFLLMENCSFSCQRNTGLAAVGTLRVLDLSHNKLDSIGVDDLLRWIKSQKRIAYLNLRRIGSLQELPDWIKKRQNLQILVITECGNLKRLPSSITRLQNLLVLDVDNCPSLQTLPQGLGRLTKLQVLSGFKLASPGKDGARLAELKTLTNLIVLKINISALDEIADDEVDSLSKLQQLKILSINTKDCGNEQPLLVNRLKPPKSIQELFLMSYHGDITPDWLTPSHLPELLYLYVEHSQITSVRTDFWGNGEDTWKIEGLCLKYLPRLKIYWETVQEKMKYLRYVEVSRCLEFQGFPCNVQNYGVWMSEE